MHSRHTRQIKLAAQKDVAAALADSLVARWFKEPEPFPFNSAGQFKSQPQYRWTTATRQRIATGPWNVVVVKLQVWHDQTTQPLIEIELLEDAVKLSRQRTGQ